MAKIRHIKVEFWTSPQIVECKPLTRLLFIGMWNFCDDGGIHVYSPKRLKMEIFPADDEILSTTIEEMLIELEKIGLVKFYVIDQEKYIKITGWHHQKPYEKFYKYPNEDGIIPPNKTYSRAQSKSKKEKKKQTVNIEATESEHTGNSEVTDGQQTSHEHGNGNGNGNGNGKENVKGDAGTPASSTRNIFKLLCQKGEVYEMKQEEVDEWTKAFPNCSVFHHLSQMELWLKKHPKQHWSLNNVPKHIKIWLKKEQEYEIEKMEAVNA